MAIVLGVLCAILACVVVALVAALRRKDAEIAGHLEHVEQLEADLATALRPPPAQNTTERAISRMIRTASKVREQGITGMIQSTIEDLSAWANEEQAEIVHMAAPDGTVTIFFSDIENSTQLNARMGDKDWVRVLEAHDQVLRGRITQYRGQVVKTAGDGFMVAFRDAEAACRAAVAIQSDLRRPSELLRRHGKVRVRIGIHTGQVVAKDGDYFGENVALAARVADLASGGEVLCSDAVRDHLEDDASVSLVDPTEPLELKGLPGRYVVWRVVPPVS
ncbi:adenylate/guanylate cyclase domain-containing protein [Nocardioides humilatus]|uniref:Adenylate/guanylate cyclase domain-containing protein n=1 Tax=Nocardioides humilatus TaxID=2607660 RepID=A0A5B1LF72_9ACTN|nr:adenylate/guanylate cyclase domain-containing protein [Nocardioides humilatus]KAA1418984.1 adenylate/guanylate cyclase domain-containing protein [Nocardioides humilatus]